MRSTDFRLTRKNVMQFVAYLVGGSVYFWSGYLVFAVGYSGLHWRWLPAKLLADVVGWTLNYLVQRHWAFASRSLEGHEGATVGRFTLVSAANLALDYLIIYGLNRVGVSPYLGFFISAGFFTVWNYFWYRFWVFLRRNNKSMVG